MFIKEMLGGIAPDWLWVSFGAGIAVLLILDLFVFHRDAHIVPPREAVIVSAFWIGLALLFSGWFSYQFGWAPGAEFFAGYLIEKSLSMDNVFVILLIFASLKIQPQYHHRVLFWGIFGAVVLRTILILAGVKLIDAFGWILYVFGGILVYSAIKFLRDDDKSKVHAENHVAVRFLKQLIPVTTETSGQSFFLRQGGRITATPLFVALVLIEATDLIFAVDSIPAVLAVTRDPFIAFASNLLAILGLRALYFVIANWVSTLRFLKPGLAVLLGFIGIKMLIADFLHVPIWVSLTVILLILLTAALGSWYYDRLETPEKTDEK